MNSETYATDYTLEEQAMDRWQEAPPVLHLTYNGGTGRVIDVSRDREPDFYDDSYYDVRYVRSDLFDAKAAELETALKHAHGLHTDLATLDESRIMPADVFLVLERTARGGVPVCFAYSKEDAQMLAELYSADARGASYDYAKLHIGTITLDLTGENE